MLVRSKKGFQLWLITSRHTEPEASSTFGWNILRFIYFIFTKVLFFKPYEPEASSTFGWTILCVGCGGVGVCGWVAGWLGGTSK